MSKMSKIQMLNKINDLKFWLDNNPHHFDFAKKLQQKKQLELKILNKEYA